MDVSAEGLALIRRFEGFSPTVYDCPAGLPTIGYGHVVGRGETFGRIGEREAERLLLGDARIAARAVARLISAQLRQGQFDALVSFTFNLGAGKLQASTLRRVVNRHEHAAVPAELMRWVFARGRAGAGGAAARGKPALSGRFAGLVSRNRHKTNGQSCYNGGMENSGIAPQTIQLEDGRIGVPLDQHVAAQPPVAPKENLIAFAARAEAPAAARAETPGALIDLAARRKPALDGRKAASLSDAIATGEGIGHARPDVLESLRAQVKAPLKTPPKAPIPYEAQLQRDLEMQHKVGLAASLLVGAVSLAGAWNCLSKAVTKDEQGKAHLDSANVMYGIVNLSLAAVNGVFAAQALKHGGRQA